MLRRVLARVRSSESPGEDTSPSDSSATASSPSLTARDLERPRFLYGDRLRQPAYKLGLLGRTSKVNDNTGGAGAFHVQSNVRMNAFPSGGAPGGAPGGPLGSPSRGSARTSSRERGQAVALGHDGTPVNAVGRPSISGGVPSTFPGARSPMHLDGTRDGYLFDCSPNGPAGDGNFGAGGRGGREGMPADSLWNFGVETSRVAPPLSAEDFERDMPMPPSLRRDADASPYTFHQSPPTTNSSPGLSLGPDPSARPSSSPPQTNDGKSSLEAPSLAALPPLAIKRRRSSLDMRFIGFNGVVNEAQRIVVRVEMDERQEQIYTTVLRSCRRDKELAVKRVIPHLRLLCNSLDLVPEELAKLHENPYNDKEELLNQSLAFFKSALLPKDEICSICLETRPELETSCRHNFHALCFYDWSMRKPNQGPATRPGLGPRAPTNGSDPSLCPMCRAPISWEETRIKTVPGENYAAHTLAHLDHSGLTRIESPKIGKILECLNYELFHSDEGNHGTGRRKKIIVVSSFAPVLRVLGSALSQVAHFWIFPNQSKGQISDNANHWTLSLSPAVLLVHSRCLSSKMNFSKADLLYFCDPWIGNSQSLCEALMECKGKRQSATKKIVYFVAMSSIEEAVTTMRLQKLKNRDSDWESAAAVTRKLLN